MLYHLFTFLDKQYNVIGAGLFQYSTFRAALTFIVAMLLATLIGKRIIVKLKKLQIGEEIRDLGLYGQEDKKGTPTMGGVIMIIAILIPILLFAELNNVYIWLIILTVVMMGGIGFIDDYIKVFKKDKEGIKGRYKIIAQISLGIIVGAVLYTHDDVRVKDFERVYFYKIEANGNINWDNPIKTEVFKKGRNVEVVENGYYVTHDTKSFKTNVPFLKDNLLDYSSFLKPFTNDYAKWGWIVFIPIVIFIITAVSNAANLTDGIDGLASGISAINMLTLGLFAFVSGILSLLTI
jgi:phospho-N-acetylmuramoyl-pentapeptide-transferase